MPFEMCLKKRERETDRDRDTETERDRERERERERETEKQREKQRDRQIEVLVNAFLYTNRAVLTMHTCTFLFSILFYSILIHIFRIH